MTMGPSEVRIVMAKAIAEKWLEARANKEYRLNIYFGMRNIKNLPDLLRSFRDEKITIAGVRPLSDLGISENFDGLQVWSANREALVTLKDWVETRGLETSGVW